MPGGDAAAAWLVSRVVAFGALLVAGSVEHDGFTAAWAWSWDGGWYRQIAFDGYGGPIADGAQSRWPFFPLLPGVIRGFEELGVSGTWGALVVNNLALLAALAGVHRLATSCCTARGARIAVWAAAVAPITVVHSMLYPSAIFFAATTWAFALAWERRDVAAGFAALCATMVRPNGALVPAVLAVAVVAGVGLAGAGRGALAGPEGLIPVRRLVAGARADLAPRLRRAVVLTAPSAVGFLAFLAYSHRRADDAIAFWHGKYAWDEVAAWEVLRMELEHPRLGAFVPHVVVGALALGALLLVVRRLPVDCTALAAVLLLPPAVLAVVGLGRYVGETFPVALALGMLGERVSDRVVVPLLAASAAGGVVFTIAMTHHAYLP